MAWAIALSVAMGIASDGAGAENDLPFIIEPTSPATNMGGRLTVRLKINRKNLNQASVFEIKFDDLGEDWHVASDWEQSTGDEGSPPSGVWFATLQSFRKGDRTIPKASLRYYTPRGQPANSTAFGKRVTVMGYLSDADQVTKIKPLRPLEKMGIDPRTYWMIAAAGCVGAALAILVLWLWHHKYRDPEKAEQIAGRGPDPWEWALAEIEQKRNLPSVIQGDGKLIATLASEILRAYLGRRFNFHALEMTSFECVRHLKAGVAPPVTIPPIQKFLETCDLIKFSTHEIDRGNYNQFWDEATRIVKMTIRGDDPEPEFNLKQELAMHEAGHG